MLDTEGSQSIIVEPQNVLVFYRNDFRSATSIKIVKNRDFQESITFQLKSTNRNAYLVSQRTGQITPNQRHKYITILINDSASLEECIHDKFKLILNVPKKGPFQKKFKVIIDYKKEQLRQQSGNNLHWDLNSKSSGTVASTKQTVSQSMAAMKKTLLHKAGSLMSSVAEDKHGPQERIKQELDEMVKSVEQRRRKLNSIQMEISKNKSKRRLMFCLALLVMILMIFMGIVTRKMVIKGVKYGQKWVKGAQL